MRVRAVVSPFAKGARLRLLKCVVVKYTDGPPPTGAARRPPAFDAVRERPHLLPQELVAHERAKLHARVRKLNHPFQPAAAEVCTQ